MYAYSEVILPADPRHCCTCSRLSELCKIPPPLPYAAINITSMDQLIARLLQDGDEDASQVYFPKTLDEAVLFFVQIQASHTICIHMTVDQGNVAARIRDAYLLVHSLFFLHTHGSADFTRTTSRTDTAAFGCHENPWVCICVGELVGELRFVGGGAENPPCTYLRRPIFRRCGCRVQCSLQHTTMYGISLYARIVEPPGKDQTKRAFGGLVR